MKAAKRPSRPRRERDSGDLRRERDSGDLRGKREELFDLVYPLARRAAGVRSSAARPRYSDIDKQDLEQEALFGVWCALERFDKSRASARTFVERIVCNSIGSILRRDRAGKRTRPDEYGPLIESGRLLLALEFRLDIDRVLKTLGRRERKVAGLLEEYHPAEIARALGISRPALYRIIDLIRKSFVEAGLS
jgi:RNA polymerase sigma factor (sigma-70 family)